MRIIAEATRADCGKGEETIWYRRHGTEHRCSYKCSSRPLPDVHCGVVARVPD